MFFVASGALCLAPYGGTRLVRERMGLKVLRFAGFVMPVVQSRRY